MYDINGIECCFGDIYIIMMVGNLFWLSVDTMQRRVLRCFGLGRIWGRMEMVGVGNVHTVSVDADAPVDSVKVSKLMGMLGVCSRRKAEQLIKEGNVLADNKPVTSVATRVFPYGTKIRVDKKDVIIGFDLIVV